METYDRSVFDITPSFIVVTFPYASDFERSMSEDAAKNERSMSEDAAKNERSMSEVLNETEIKKLKPILDFLESRNSITPKEARDLIGKSAATARRYLTLLCEHGFLEPAGNTSAATYRLKQR
ncbi:MAG: hypothetical protein LBT26_11320 [Clostridiales Family XIII bacterium]|nr:hypothetical protein [Clostridiales Family XIII bacterium]